jgi:hypothetical protein
VNEIVAFLHLLPRDMFRNIMSQLEAVSAHELVSHGRNERLGRRGRLQSGYDMLLHAISFYRNERLELLDERSGNATAEDSDTAEETAAALDLSHRARTVLELMDALGRDNVWQIELLHERVLSVFRPLGEVDTGVIAEDVSSLASAPTESISIIIVPTERTNGENAERSSV